MKDLHESICDHWRYRADMDAIEKKLALRSRSLDSLSADDLGILDQMHSGLDKATVDFAHWTGIAGGISVLDLGSGLGGSARYLATHHGSRVTAVELSPDLHRTAEELTDLTGLGKQVRHLLGSFLEVELDEQVDAVWIQHVDMQIPDKATLYSRISDVLRPGGAVYWHDWMLGSNGPPRYPVPWCHDGTASHPVASQSELERLLANAGLVLCRLETRTPDTIDWFEKLELLQERNLSRAKSAEPSVKKHLASLVAETAGIIDNMNEDRLVPFYGAASTAGTAPQVPESFDVVV